MLKSVTKKDLRQSKPCVWMLLRNGPWLPKYYICHLPPWKHPSSHGVGQALDFQALAWWLLPIYNSRPSIRYPITVPSPYPSGLVMSQFLFKTRKVCYLTHFVWLLSLFDCFHSVRNQRHLSGIFCHTNPCSLPKIPPKFPIFNQPALFLGNP